MELKAKRKLFNPLYNNIKKEKYPHLFNQISQVHDTMYGQSLL